MVQQTFRPLIGISCSIGTGRTSAQLVVPPVIDFLPQAYSGAVEAAGGLPLMLPLAQEMATLALTIARLDGLILTGGPDVSPRLFGQEPIAGLGPTNYHRDLMEQEVLRRGFERGLPILTICRGMQMLIPAFGGSLYQHLPGQVEGCLEHRQNAGKEVLTHRVAISPHSRLSQVMEAESIWVNSIHHQAIKEPPPGFLVTARASDGVIEAVERPGESFLLGVQWHPEGSTGSDVYSRKLFAAFVAAAAGE